jgi:RNA polymerase sigma-70 factor (ECF subfamily)
VIAENSSEALTGHKEAGPKLEAAFRLHYRRLEHLIRRIVRDQGRAEELAVDVFLRWPPAHSSDPLAVSGWLTKAAVRLALDEVRRQRRRARLDTWLAGFGIQPSHEGELLANDRRSKVIETLARLKARDAELLILRAEGLSYQQAAAALSLNPASVGRLISKAQQRFRREFEKRYGQSA